MLTVIDIETIPDLRDGAIQRCIDAIEPPGNYKKPESIAEWKAANAATLGAEQWQRTALDPMCGSIGVICWAVESGEIRHVCREPNQSESDMLSLWLTNLKADLNDGGGMRLPRWTGWNVADFDLRFLAIRLAVHGLKPPFSLPVNSRYDGTQVCDLMKVWSGYKGYQKQSAVAEVLGIEVPDKTDGADIWRLVQEKGIDAAVSKCKSDVEVLRQIYWRMQPIFGC